MKVALITGITGQDGSYLAELLLEKGYEVHGIVRRASMINTHRIDHIYDKLSLHYGDLTDSTNLVRVIQQVQPDEIYNLGAQSHVKVSFEMPEYTGQTDAIGTLRVLEAVRLLEMEDRVRIYQASTSELYGLVQETPQRETTPFYPRSPYGVAKLYGHWITKNYRESYDMFAVHGTLFNHEGTKRGEEFVTRKITKGVARIKKSIDLGEKFKPIELGNIYAQRDWSDSEDFVEGVWLMLTQDKPRDYVLASGESHTIKEFVDRAFVAAQIEGSWRETPNDALKTKFHNNSKEGEVLVKINPEFYRPNEVELLLGDPTDIKLELGWKPKVSFCDLVKKMVQHDLNE